MITDITAWLDELPHEDLLSDNADGPQFISIGRVEVLLDDFTDSDWSTRNFNFKVIDLGEHGIFFSGSIELIVNYDHSQQQRIIAGASTLPIKWFQKSDGTMNEDFEPTLLAECVKNAAKQLGKKFGRHLNERIYVDAVRRNKKFAAIDKNFVKKKPDAIIQAQYDKGDAKLKSHLSIIYDFENK